MTYVAGTILSRNEPFGEDNEPHLAAYNEIKVIGYSPNKPAGPRLSEWGNEESQLLSIQPTSFGEVKDRPFGELQRDYSVVSVPEKKGISLEERNFKSVEPPAASPEQRFKAEAAIRGDKQSETRQRTNLATS